MSFLRHHEIYRSDVGIKTILGLGPCTASRWPAPSHEKGCGFNPAPFPSSAMSLGSAIPRQVALQQCPPPLHRPESMLYPPAETVNHHLTGAGEFSTGTLGNFQPVLTHSPQAKAYASHCTSFAHCATTRLAGTLFENLTPWAFRGGFSPGCSYKQSFLPL